MKSLINEIVEEYKFENEDIQHLVYKIKNNTQIQLKTDFDLLVNLYRLKLKYLELLHDKAQKENTFIGIDTFTQNCVYKGKKKPFTYFKLCKELFGLSEKTVYKYNQFAQYYIKNVEILASENLVNNPEYEYEIFNKMSISKLMELNCLLTWQVQRLVEIGVLTENLTREQIRAIVKKAKILHSNFKKEDFVIEEEQKEEKEKPEEPEFLIDNETEYNLFDFKKYSKAKLTMIAFDCYTKYLSLKKKLLKKKKEGN